MKTLFTAGLLLLSLFACNDREQNTTVLPPATQTGANTGGALVDGKVWVASIKYINQQGGSGTFCENVGNYYKIQIDLRGSTNTSRILIQLNKENFEINKVYDLPISLDDYNKIGASYGDSNNNIFFAQQPNFTGKIKITRLDIPNNIVSGTFEFKAVDNNGHIINITDGRFDKKFD